MTADEVRRRAIAGVGVIGIQGVLLRAAGLGGSVVLARLLTPRDFGLVAVGTTLVFFGSFLSNAGVGAALVRRPEAPSRADLEAFLGMQLAIVTLLALGTAAAAWPFGEAGILVAVMVASLPVTALRTPAAIVLERQLLYRPLALVQVGETVAYFGWAIATVWAGWGVWGLATAAVFRAAVGTVTMLALAKVVMLRPRLSWGRLRSLLGFGIRYQAAGFVRLLRDQGINIGTVAIAGLPVLGLWSLAGRVLSVPFVLFESLWRVSYPAMSRLLAAGENPRPAIEAGVARVSVATGFVLAGLVGAAPALVPFVFGSQWAPAADVLPWAALGLLVSGPISAAASGYLYAIGDASTVLRSIVIESVVYCAVAFSLLPSLGVAALGLAWMAAALVEALILGRAVASGTGARLVEALAAPALAAVAAGAVGWLVSSSASPTLASAVLGGLSAEGVYLAALVVLRRRLLGETVRVTGRALRTSVARA